MAPHAIQRYATQIRATLATGLSTAETSHYPALYDLLTAAGLDLPTQLAPLSQVSDPALRAAGFPDFGLIERGSNVLIIPVEVKGLDGDLDSIVASDQARKYAKNFGGGYVVVTNLWQWSLAELGPDGALKERPGARVAFADSADDFRAGRLISDLDAAWADLRVIISEASRARGTVTTPQQVANLLAYHAKRMRDQVNAAGDADEVFAALRNALSEGLQIELSGEHTAPTVVQTLVYGIFAGWLEAEDPTRFDWMQSAFLSSVPVFAEILHEALRPSLLRRCNLLPHLDNVERVLRWTDRDAFTAGFDGDAIQYFYEPFLAAFDPLLRKDLGIWYTPREVADYQIARVHRHIVEDLDVIDGLADEGVYLLDPAVGTGTYLIAACDFLYQYHTNNGEPTSVAAQKCLDALTRRFIGFEVLPAAFIICHLHLGRHLSQLGANPGDQRLRVYLTNSLTGWDPSTATPGLTLFPELEDELHDAAVAKHHDPVLAVVGNPPYQGYSTAETDEERSMMADWLNSGQRWGLRKLRMNDLYVRFWKVAIHRVVDLTGKGIISFITNRSWLGGRSYPAMRDTIVHEFDRIWVDDLHGSAHDRSVANDQSIFTTNIADGIRVGTGIVTAVRFANHVGPAIVSLADHRGTAVAKRAGLTASLNGGITGSEITPTKASRYRFVSDSVDDLPALDDYLTFLASGPQELRNESFLSVERSGIEQQMVNYYDPEVSWDDLLEKYPNLDVRKSEYDAAAVRQRLQNGAVFESGRLVPFMFKPFDYRWLYWETRDKLLHRARKELFPYWGSIKGQVSLVAPQTPRRVGAIRPFPSRGVPMYESVDPNARVFPLYGLDANEAAAVSEGRLFEASASGGPTMVAPEWVVAAKRVLECGDKEAGEAIFYAIVAVTNSPLWLESQLLESDTFAEVPLPADAKTLRQAEALGRRLVDLFDPHTPVDGVTRGSVADELRSIAVPDQANGVVKLDGKFGERAGLRTSGRVEWTRGAGWSDVPDEVWNYTLGGFPVLSKFLSYRVRQGLTQADRGAFRLICRRIAAILALGSACDSIYASSIADTLAVD